MRIYRGVNLYFELFFRVLKGVTQEQLEQYKAMFSMFDKVIDR